MNSKTQLKQALKQKDDSIDGFISDITFVVNATHEKNRKDNDIISIRDGFLVARRENPEVVMLQIAPYLWKYRQDIINKNFNKLLNNDYEEEISEITGSLPEYSNFDKVTSIMQKIKRSWHLFSSAEQNIIQTKFIKLISHYATYIGACKALQ